jgi:glutamyl-tRNA synthetase/nondiscriminating glutamyl-tRNA synthetase
MEKLYWLNRHYIKQCELQRLTFLGLEFFAKSGVLDRNPTSPPNSDRTVFVEKSLLDWFSRVTELFAPYVDRLDQLPERASPIFSYDARAALAAPENAEVLAWPQTKAVLDRFAVKVLENESAQVGKLSAEEFNKIVSEVKAETDVKGKELFHPIRIVVMGSHSGPAFDKLIPVLEEGSRLNLPKHVLSVRERVEAFSKARLG